MHDQHIPDPDGFPAGCVTRDPAGTRALAARVADRLRGGEVLLLYGPLGAGKTCFVRGLCAALGAPEEVVSPTFTLVDRHAGDLVVYHLDFFRVEPGADLADIGVPDLLDAAAGGAVLAVEWPEPLLPLLDERVELLALPGPRTDERIWRWRGVPVLPAGWDDLGREDGSSC